MSCVRSVRTTATTKNTKYDKNKRNFLYVPSADMYNNILRSTSLNTIKLSARGVKPTTPFRGLAACEPPLTHSTIPASSADMMLFAERPASSCFSLLPSCLLGFESSTDREMAVCPEPSGGPVILAAAPLSKQLEQQRWVYLLTPDDCRMHEYTSLAFSGSCLSRAETKSREEVAHDGALDETQKSKSILQFVSPLFCLFGICDRMCGVSLLPQQGIPHERDERVM